MLSWIRMFLMGVHFIVAGALGLLLVLCRPFNPDNSRLCARLYGVPAMWILGLGVRAEVESLKGRTGSCVLVANHQSNYDLFTFGTIVPYRTVAMGKKSLKWLPFFGQIFWLAGNVLVDRSNAYKARRSMLDTADILRNTDTSIWIFPEGTRNQGQTLLPFKKGAFQMAIAAGVPIIPVCANRYASHLQLNRWNSGEVMIRSLEPIPTAGLTSDDIPRLMQTCREQMHACIEAMEQELKSTTAGELGSG